MDFQIGDIVTTGRYKGAVLYRLCCYFDRGPDLICTLHEKEVGVVKGFDDVHLEVIWKATEKIAPDWKLGDTICVDVGKLEAANEMFVIALAASEQGIDLS